MTEEDKSNVSQDDKQNKPDQSQTITEADKLKAEKDEYLDGWKRAKADLANYKKDEIKRFEGVLKFANEQIIKDIIVVLDSFDLAVEAMKDDPRLEKGIYLIRAQLEDVLKKYGLERISVSVGQQFDPSVHDAVMAVESDSPSGTVIDEIEKGYMLYGKLVRAAKVKVSK